MDILENATPELEFHGDRETWRGDLRSVQLDIWMKRLHIDDELVRYYHHSLSNRK